VAARHEAGLAAASAADDEVAEAAMRYNRAALDWSRGRANEAVDSYAARWRCSDALAAGR